MKVLAIAALATVSIAQNDDIDERKFGHLFRMVWSKVESKTSLEERTFKNQIRNYGCYCLPIGSRVNTAQAGTPVDQYDKACRDLARCYKCLDIDYEIDAVSDKFRWAENTNGDFDCSDSRNTEGQKAHCQCDAEFAMTIAAKWDDSAYNFAHWENGRNNAYSLDKENVCVAQSGDARSDECCGNYPARFPYPQDLFDCCSDGKARMVC